MGRVKLALIVAIGLAIGGVAGAKAVTHHAPPGTASAPLPRSAAPRAHARDERRARVAGAAAGGPAATMRANGPYLVPQAKTKVVVDGEFGDEAWTKGAILRTGAFAERPYSDARFVWREGTLYLTLYAADEDLRAAGSPLSDSYTVRFRVDGQERALKVSPAGDLIGTQRTGAEGDESQWESGTKIALDRDGTVDNPADNDEEWVVEMAVPLAALGLKGTPGERVGIELERCDFSRGMSRPTCFTWGGNGAELELAP